MSDDSSVLWNQVYDELRTLAKAKLKNEKPGQTLQATAMVNEVYLRMQVQGQDVQWTCKKAFFKAAAEAMRRILVDQARRKNAIKRGQSSPKQQVEPHELAELAIDFTQYDLQQVLQLDDGLQQLVLVEPLAAKVVELRFFTGLKQADVAETLDISIRTCDRLWAFARAWLYRYLKSNTSEA